MQKKPHMIVIRDGWGFSPDQPNNAIEACHPVHHNTYIETYPSVLIHTSGEYVGLPEGNQGSSEVGHLNIGAGRIVLQNLVRIFRAQKGCLTARFLTMYMTPLKMPMTETRPMNS
ncbi:hypothetical protein [Desulfobacter sp.]